MKQLIIHSFLLVLTALFGLHSRAAILPSYTSIYTPVGGTPVSVGNPEAFTQVVMVTPSGGTHTDRFKKGVVTFGVNHHYPNYFSSMRVEIRVHLIGWTDLSSSSDVDTTFHLEISYSPEDSLQFTDKQSLLFENLEKYSIEIEDIVVNGSATGTLPANLYVNADIYVDRYYDFSAAAVSFLDIVEPSELDPDHLIDSDCDGHYDELLITWKHLESAEEYQLEWVYINDFKPDGTFYTDSELSYDFKHNSTRIATTDNEYRISLAYDRGYICYRVRAIGRATSDLTQRIFGVWTEPSEQGTVDGVRYYFKNYSWQPGMNWQFSATYAEEGKKKEVVSFYDGTLRNRQMVTQVNSDNNTIVGETIYDSQGRPVIQVLPTPVQDLDCAADESRTSLKYYPDFTQNMSDEAYSRYDFDTIGAGADSCAIHAKGMGSGSGASRYYSGDNPNQLGEQAFVPDAEHFPFTQVEYTPDNTGRIRRQGGVGEDFQLGSGHESRYYYGHPSQLQLDRMFGSEVGDASHYQKNMMVDPNGQVSVSYLDQEGRVIATSLAGSVPSNLTGIPSQSVAAVTLTEDLFSKDTLGNSTSNRLVSDGHEKLFKEAILVTSDNTPMTFDYAMNVEAFSDSCLAEEICFTCVYDLVIKVIDECGVDRVDAADTIIPSRLGQFTLDSLGMPVFSIYCEPSDYEGESFTLTLGIGSYQVIKSLRVNEAAKAYYLAAYLDSNLNTCIKTLHDFELEYLANTNFDDCMPKTSCDSCIAHLGTLEQFTATGGTAVQYQSRLDYCAEICREITPCEAEHIMLLGDMSPGGQYGQFEDANGLTNPTDAVSIYNPANRLPYSEGTSQISWRNPQFITSGLPAFEYRNEDGSTRTRIQVTATLNSSGAVTASMPAAISVDSVFHDASTGEYYTYPEYLASLDDFVNAWQASWANSLIVYHPEYSFYRTCLDFGEKTHETDAFTSDSFDNLLRKTDTWQGAVSAGLIKSDYASYPNVNDRLTNWFSSVTTAWDPFVVNLSAYDNYGTGLVSQFGHYQSIGSADFSMAEVAAMSVRCSSAMGGLPAISCFRFGDDVLIGDAAYNDSIRNTEWQNLRSFYLSAKQLLQHELAVDRSVNNASYYGYNGCIGNTSFNPHENGFFDYVWPAIASAPYFNAAQPCSITTHPYYRYKVKRFMSPLTDLNADVNNVTYQSYLMTGQCPSVASLQTLLSQVAASDSLTDASFLVSEFNTFSGFYLAMNDYYVSAPMPVYTWTRTYLSTTALHFNITDPFLTSLGSFSLSIPSGSSFGWSDITGFSALNASGSGFAITASVDSAGVQLLKTITGTASFDLDNCRFDEVCTPNQLAQDLSLLMDALASGSDLNSSTAVQLKGGGSVYAPLVTAPLQFAAGGPDAAFFWNYDATATTFRFYGPNAADVQLEMKINGTEPGIFSLTNLGLIKGIREIVPTQANTFDVVCEDLAGNYLVTLKCQAITNFNSGANLQAVALGECALPTPVLCEGQAFQNVKDLLPLFRTVIAFPTADWFDTPFMTANLASQFAGDTVFSIVTDTTIAGVHTETTVVSTGDAYCPIILTLSDHLTPELGLNNLINPGEFFPVGARDAYGDYHAFGFPGTFFKDSQVYHDTVYVTTCLPLDFCQSCLDTITLFEPDTTELLLNRAMELSNGYIYEDHTPEFYADYAASVTSLNDRMGWEPGDALFVVPADYTIFSSKGMKTYAKTYAKFIGNFDPELDNRSYLEDPDQFLQTYGYHTNVLREYDRYSAAVNRYNEDAAAAGLDTLPVVTDSVFAHSLAAENLHDYIDHLTGSITSGENAMDVESFVQSGTAGRSFGLLEEEDENACETLYNRYVDAYLYFESVQDTAPSCENYESYAPMAGYEYFTDYNLCCNPIGRQIVEDYIDVLLSGTECPYFLPMMGSCDGSEYNDTVLCHGYWEDLQDAFDLFNTSAWAVYNGISLTNDYTDYDAFAQMNYCFCVKEYTGYLYSWIFLDSTTVFGMPITLSQFCGHTTADPEPDPCEAAYQQYFGCVTSFNTWALANDADVITAIVTYQTFVEQQLCDCVDLYCSELTNAMSGLKDPAGVPLISLMYTCLNATITPCTPSAPIPTAVVFPDAPFSDPCTEYLTSIAYANALNAYEDYIDSVTQFAGQRYVEHCMGVFESFTRTWTDQEYHRTLYYYDQAGNLVKTVPPEGVELLPITSYTDALASAVRADRQYGTHSVLTSHRMETKYAYNSLNQLVRQATPDQDKMNIWEITLPNGLYAGLNTTAIQMVTPSRGYLSGYITLPSGTKRGLLYRTDNGGTNWTKVNNTVAAKLRRIEMATATVGFAVGENGIALQTIDGGTTWDLLNLYGTGLGITGELRDVLFTSSTAGRFVGEGATVVAISLSGAVATPSAGTLTLPPAISGTHSIVRIKSLDYAGGKYFYAVTLLNGTQEYDAVLSGSSLSSTTLGEIRGFNYTTVSYYSSTEGIVMGQDGDIVRIETPATGTAFKQSMHKSGIVYTPLRAFFMDADHGIGLFANGGSTLGYYTTNGGTEWTSLSALNGMKDLSLVQQGTNVLELVATGNDAATRRILWNNLLPLPDIFDHTNTVLPQTGIDLVAAAVIKDTYGPSLIVAGAENGKLYVSNGLTTGVETTDYTLIGQLNASNLSEKAAKITLHRFSTGAVSGVIVSTEGDLYALHRNAGASTFAISVISHGLAFADFRDAVLEPGNTDVYAFDNSTNKLHSMHLQPTTAVSSTTALSLAASSSAGIPAMGISSGRITLAGNNGELTTSNAISGGAALSAWTERYQLEATAINDLHASGSDLAAVGENGLVLYSTTPGKWSVKGMQATSDLYSVKTSGTSQVVVGAKGFAQLMTSAPTHSALMTNQGISTAELLPDADLHDVAVRGDTTYIVGTGGTVLYSPNPATVAFKAVSGTHPVDFYAAFIPAGQNGVKRLIAGGSGSMIWKFQGVNGSQQKGVFSSALADVHFADINTGTLAGADFFVRQTTDGGQSWKVVMPATNASTQLTATIRRVWTKPNGFAILGGVNYFATVDQQLATNTSISYTINDIGFRDNSSPRGVMAGSDGRLHPVQLIPSGGAYTVTLGAPSGAVSSDLRALHLFENGNVMAAGSSNMVALWTATTGAWTDFSPAATAGVSPTFNDIFFHDDVVGYVVGNEGIVLRSTNVTIDPLTHTITAIDFEQQSVFDGIVSANDQADITSIAFGSRYEGIWGGNYASISLPDQQHTAYVRKIRDESREFSSSFYYDRLGRIVASQNSRQWTAEEYSYTRYDELGRVTEAGVKVASAAEFGRVFGTTVGGQYVPSVIDDERFSELLDDNYASTRREVTQSYYDKSVITGLPVSFVPDALTQRKRITHVTYEAVYDGDDATYEHATHYDYDIHGNVQTLLQDNQKLSLTDVNLADQRFKRMDYNYDLVSGNVHRVDYETGNADQWHHAYRYDADNRITEAYTNVTTPLMDPALGQTASQNEPGMTPYWDKEVSYQYYDHGPLARTELGQENVQGLDYTYTLQGWMKGVNSNTLYETRDPGQDGIAGKPHGLVGRDAYSFSLHYFEGDYTGVDAVSVGNSANVFAEQAGSDLTANNHDLYNGNIARMVTTLTHPDTREVLPLGNFYNYDQLNRLVSGVNTNNIDRSGNYWNPANMLPFLYTNEFKYDANGNITKQYRTDDTESPIDNFTYRYQDDASGKRLSNRLYHVDDAVPAGDWADDIDDMGTFTTGALVNGGNNYVYDEEGRLISDAQEGIAQINWRVDGKVKEIIRPLTSTRKNLKFDYDAMGNRIAKHTLSSSDELEHSTYYVLDASGNTMAVYEQEIVEEASTKAFYQSEKHIYGSSRLGILNDKIGLLGAANEHYDMTLTSHVIGKRNYELSNHLGNVLTVVSDKPVPHGEKLIDYWLADIRQATDYSPFGVTLSGRNFTLSGAEKSRFGFNGKEADNEVKGEGNSYDFDSRMYDSRLGRFLSVDPDSGKYPYWSPYSYAMNSPVLMIDHNGRGPIIGWLMTSMEQDDVNKTYTINYQINVQRSILLVNLSKMNLPQSVGGTIAKAISSVYSSYSLNEQFTESNADDKNTLALLRTQYSHIPEGYTLIVNVKLDFYSTGKFVKNLDEIVDNQAMIVAIVDDVGGTTEVGVCNQLDGDATLIEAPYCSPTNIEQSGVSLKASNGTIHEILHDDGASDLYGAYAKDKPITKSSSVMRGNTSFELDGVTQKEIVRNYLILAREAHDFLMGEEYAQKGNFTEKTTKVQYQKSPAAGGRVQYDTNPSKTNKDGLKSIH